MRTMDCMSESLWRGLCLGFSIAAPVGPIGLLVLKRSLEGGRTAGLACGLGAALADLVYGLLAASGVRMAAGYQGPVAIAGGVCLFYLAWKTWRAPVAESAARAAGAATTFALTISNPMTILAFAAMVASAGAAAPTWFVAGVFAGSMLWWTILSSAAGWLGTRVSANRTLLNRASALMLAAFGVWAIWRRLAV